MATVFPIGQTVFQNGDTPIPTRAIPVGTTSAMLTLDVNGINKAIGQSLVFNLFVFDGVNDLRFFADFDGPWHDKQNVLHTDSSLTISFGTAYVDGVAIPRVSAAGWQIRGVIAAVNGPISSAGGSLTVS